IFGHPKVHLEVLPTLDCESPKKMFTTGAITHKNYTDSKAGKKGEFNHTFGFVIVELDGDVFHARQITAKKNGDFNDIYHKVRKGKVTPLKNIEGIVL